MRKLLSAILTAALVLLSVTACGSRKSDQPPLASGSVIVADDSIPDVAPNISGVVTSMTRVRDGVTLLVEIPGKNNSYMGDKVYVTATSKTVVESESKTRYDDPEQIIPGDTVSVWYSGSSTGTTPAYAMAQGVRVTSQVEDLLLTVRHGETTVMASPAEGEVTSSDIHPLFYGSYLVSHGEGNLFLYFAKKPMKISATAVSASSKEDATPYHFKSDDSSLTAEIPANLPQGDYTVTVKAEYEDSADYYIFTLSIRP